MGYMDPAMKDALESSSGHSYQSPQTKLTSCQDQVRQHALDTFGDEDKALHWLNRQNQLFGGRTPIEALETEPDAVERELVRIDHGIFV
jgi:uncharacterized protein (DUF2384 family)